ncbi:hypothetical protein BJ165DRAFT_1514996 [Panaeolus papilionaceus]|nr:hypothetical protein BJ165DRAFT_1514996 [Panaeolus papilionaceus]
MRIKSSSLTQIATVALTFTSAINAQNWWNQLPGCSQTCAAVAAQQAGCNLIDIKCICRSSTFLNDLITCIFTSGCPHVEAAIAEFVVSELCNTT